MSTTEEITQQADALELRGQERRDFLSQGFERLTKARAEREAREAELERLRLQLEMGARTSDSSEGPSKGGTVSSKLPRLPAFVDGKDDVDIWLLRFERFAESNKWPRDDWSTSLSALLSGRALEAYGRLPIETARDYDEVKTAILKRYNLTEEGYRQKFRTCVPEDGESPEMFIVRIQSFLGRWVDLAGTERTFDGVRDLFVRERFMDACPRDLSVHLRGRDLRTLDEYAAEADRFLRARGKQLCRPSETADRGKDSPREESTGPSSAVKYRGHGQRVGPARDRQGQRLCHWCKKPGHFMRDCRLAPKRAGAGVLSRGRKLACGTAPTDSLEGVQAAAETQTGAIDEAVPSEYSRREGLTKGLGLQTVKGLVGNRTVDVLRDTGCNGVVVRRDLVEDSQLTGKGCILVKIDSSTMTAETAVIEVRTPYLCGQVEAVCMPAPLCDLIIGNVEHARAPHEPDQSVMAGAVETRAQEQRPAVKSMSVPKSNVPEGVDRARLIKLQEEDPDIQGLVKAEAPVMRRGRVITFEKRGGVVYRLYREQGNDAGVKQVVLPKALRRYVMTLAHDSITGGHLAARRTKDKIISNFWWSGLDGDVRRFCQSCDVCQRTIKRGTVATRYPEAVPLKDISTETVAEALLDIYSRLGVPEVVLSDRGTQFVSACMKEVSRLLGIAQMTTTPYHPMCNGLVERFNSTLKTILRRLCSEQPRQWHRFINAVLFAYREVPQESTHFSPFELLYGRSIRGPMRILRQLWTEDVEDPEVKSSYQYVVDLRERGRVRDRARGRTYVLRALCRRPVLYLFAN